MALQRQEAFVSGLVPITGTATGAFQPIIGRVSSGITLDVSAVVSADRRYVQLTSWSSIRPSLWNSRRQPSPVPLVAAVVAASVVPVVAVAAAAVVPAVVAVASETSRERLNCPSSRSTRFAPRSPCRIRETVMLGGQRQVDEFETEVGVPILSKIPWVNRFFTNRKQSKSEKTVLFLMRPEIIIQEETEERSSRASRRPLIRLYDPLRHIFTRPLLAGAIG